MHDIERMRTDRTTGKLRAMNDDELIEHALSWAVDMLVSRDQMNAAVHCSNVRLSPVTESVVTAHKIAHDRLAAGAQPPPEGERA